LTGSYSLHVPDIARRVLASQARERQQKDEFCGPFWVVAAVAALTGRVLTQDDAAVAAGTLLTAGGGRLADLPPGAASRADYLRQVPTTEDTRLPARRRRASSARSASSRPARSPLYRSAASGPRAY
jgi:hypothetical protein